MYVCVCHGFTDKQVKGAIADGRHSVSQIYACLGGRPRCGKCVGEVRALMACAGGRAEISGATSLAVQALQTE